jgi:hypothetical protein
MQNEPPAGTRVPSLQNADPESARLADEAVAMWQRIDAALSPIVGRLGVAVLYRRCLRTTAANDIWLSAAIGPSSSLDQSVSPDELLALHSTLAAHAFADAARVQERLLHAFRDLLSGLIGSSLTEGLIGFTRASVIGTAHADAGTSKDCNP